MVSRYGNIDCVLMFQHGPCWAIHLCQIIEVVFGKSLLPSNHIKYSWVSVICCKVKIKPLILVHEMKYFHRSLFSWPYYSQYNLHCHLFNPLQPKIQSKTSCFVVSLHNKCIWTIYSCTYVQSEGWEVILPNSRILKLGSFTEATGKVNWATFIEHLPHSRWFMYT